MRFKMVNPKSKERNIKYCLSEACYLHPILCLDVNQSMPLIINILEA